MEINGHLNEPELAEFVLDSMPAVGSHLEHCDKCLDEVTRLRDVIHGLRGLAKTKKSSGPVSKGRSAPELLQRIRRHLPEAAWRGDWRLQLWR